MNYCLILAGGNGTRMGNTKVPKQFLEIKGVPIIIRCIKNVLKSSTIDKVIVVCNMKYIEYMKKILVDNDMTDEVEIVDGGENRLMSAVNGVKYIASKYGTRENDIMLFHDSVRIFTDVRIIDENFEKAQKYGAATTVYYLEETIVKSDDEGMLYKAYSRDKRFSGQSPQTFNLQKFLKCFSALDEEQRNTFTDLSEVFFANGEKVYPVIGDKNNIKITTKSDLELAKTKLD